MCVCLPVCLYLYVHVCLHLCIFVFGHVCACLSLCIFMCVFICVCLYVHTGLCVCVCVCMRLVSVFARVSVTLMFSGDLQRTFELELRADFPRDDPAPYNPLCVSDHFFAILSCSV